jgi:predicted SAM-dependent methyltransferase
VTRTYEIVVDAMADICDLPYEPESVEKILVVQTFEHLTRTQVDQALSCWRRILQRDGILHIDVPDIEKNISLLLNADTREKREVAVRLVFGTRKDSYSYHHFGYTPEGLSRLLNEYGFLTQRTEPKQNDYPAFAIVGTKL